jgi:glutamine synthetase
LRSLEGEPVFALGDTREFSRVGQHFIAGVLTGMCELTLLFAPNINSYKRYVAGSCAPTAIRWGGTSVPAPSAPWAMQRRYASRTAYPAGM